ncbi:hypothetical protein ACFFNY_05955 [Paenibacillus hodogayensis]|uniref:Uncharacterized protein n=1 Tax=Paenibacillus hodogayensis TaxID=279208 RepID=A0ABV5VS60_9BACL
MSNRYNNSKHDASRKSDPVASANEHGELRRGRLSMIKNNNPTGEGSENEYVNDASDSRGDH